MLLLLHAPQKNGLVECGGLALLHLPDVDDDDNIDTVAAKGGGEEEEEECQTMRRPARNV